MNKSNLTNGNWSGSLLSNNAGPRTIPLYIHLFPLQLGKSAFPAPSLYAFERIYHRWNMTHAAIVTVLILAAELALVASTATLVLAVWSAIALCALFTIGKRFHPDGAGPAVPNTLTSFRVFAAVAVFVILGVAFARPRTAALFAEQLGWWMVGGLLLIETSDLLDGYLARRMRSGRFGCTWDMESDAIFAMALSLSLRHLHGVGIFVLAIGLMRYLYVLLARFDGDPKVYPKAYKLLAKTTTAILVSALIVMHAPIFSSAARSVILLSVLALQLTSFSWDFVLQRRAALDT
ncbi:MAG: CDP-alcohol phosphatidyltransferase family protein [Spirochaetota bacterium]